MTKSTNGTIKVLLAVLTLAAICIGWGIAWGSLNKDVKANAKDIEAKVETAVYQSDMRRIEEKIDTLIIGQSTLAKRIDRRHD